MRYRFSPLVLTASRSHFAAPRRTLAVLGLLLVLGAGRPAAAVTCTLDSVPAATLLLPYFELDLDNPNGLTTMFSINNASATAVLAHVVIWSDLAVPVLTFNVYLTGYDMQTMNLRDIVVYGNLPQTASAGQDPADTISPKGQYSQDINFASCQGQLPPPLLPLSFTTHLQLSLTGRASALLDNLCAGQNYGDNIARGYVTVDTVNNCTLRYPEDSGYFAPGGTGDATNQNVLWGTWFIADTIRSYVLGSNMVGIEADASNPATSTPGRYTFYGRYDGWSAADNREPLATTFAAQYFGGEALFPAGTDVIVWRDPKVAQEPFPCPARAGLAPSWYPMGTEGMVVFNEQENFLSVPVLPVCPQPPLASFQVVFPAATQKVTVNSASLPTPFPFGWFYLDLNAAVQGNVPPVDPSAAQAFVISAHTAAGRGVAVDAYRLDSACAANHYVP